MFVVSSMGGVAVPLLFHGEVHIRNFLVPSEMGKVSGGLVCTRVAIVGSVKTTRGAIPPVVVPFNGMGWVVALSRHHGIVASVAPAATVAIAAVAAPHRIGDCNVVVVEVWRMVGQWTGLVAEVACSLVWLACDGLVELVVGEDGRDMTVEVVAAGMLAHWAVQEETGCWREPCACWRLDCG
jgi:hypothetical protein